MQDMFLITVGRLIIKFLPDQFSNAEQIIHLLQTHAFCFRDEEPGENSHGKAERAEEEVCAVAAFAHCGEHGCDAAGDYEVEEPLRRYEGPCQ